MPLSRDYLLVFYDILTATITKAHPFYGIHFHSHSAILRRSYFKVKEQKNKIWNIFQNTISKIIHLPSSYSLYWQEKDISRIFCTQWPLNQSTERIKKYIFSFNLICISQSGKRIVKEFCQDEVSWRRSLLIRFKSWWMKSIWFYEVSRLIETKFTILMMVSLKSKTSFPSKSLRPAKRSVVSANKHVVPTAHRYVIY